MAIRTFVDGSSTFKCIQCGKLTRDTGRGEGETEMCGFCCEDEGQANGHYDGVHENEPAECCRLCNPAGYAEVLCEWFEVLPPKAGYVHPDVQ